MCYCLQACEQLTLQLEMGATTCPQASSEHVFAQKSPYWGACVKSVTYVLLLMCYCLQACEKSTHPAIGNGCHYLPTSLVGTCFAQKSPYWGACVKSVTYVLLLMCYCLQACEQLTLQLEMGATTCPQASSEHVLPRNLLTGGLV